MEISYELENLDYVVSAEVASRSRRGVFLFDVLVAGTSIVTGLICFGFKHFLLGVLLPVLTWFYVLKRVHGWRTVRLPEELKHEKDIITVRFLEQTLEYQTLTGLIKMEWGTFSHYVEDENYFLLITREHKLFYIIPQRAFADEQQRSAARRYFAKITNSAPAVPPIAEPR